MRKKILVIGHSLTLDENRKRWQCLAQNFQDLEVTVVVPALWEHKWFGAIQTTRSRHVKEGNYEVVPMETTHRMNWGKYRIKGLGSLLRSKRPDVIFVMQEEFTYCLHWTLLMRKIWVPAAKVLFFSWQNIEIHKSKIHKKLLWKWLCQETSAMIAGTEQIKSLFLGENYPRPIHVQTELGVDPNHFFPDEERRKKKRLALGLREMGTEREIFLVGFCGRLVPEKGILDLAQACFKLGRPWHLLAIGDGPLKRDLENLFRDAGFSECLTLTGEIPVQETADYYRAMDCLVLPSRTTPLWREQFGLVLAQGLLAGTMVVGSNSGAIPEVIGDSRLIFPEGDVEALTHLLEQIRDRAIVPMGDAAHKERFTIKSLARETYGLIQGLDL